MQYSEDFSMTLKRMLDRDSRIQKWEPRFILKIYKPPTTTFMIFAP